MRPLTIVVARVLAAVAIATSGALFLDLFQDPGGYETVRVTGKHTSLDRSLSRHYYVEVDFGRSLNVPRHVFEQALPGDTVRIGIGRILHKETRLELFRNSQLVTTGYSNRLLLYGLWLLFPLVVFSRTVWLRKRGWIFAVWIFLAEGLAISLWVKR